MSVARLLEYTTLVPLGTYDEYFVYSTVLGTKNLNHVCGLVVDYTYVGAIILMLFFGAVESQL